MVELISIHMLRTLSTILIVFQSTASYAENVVPHNRLVCGASRVEIFNSNDVKQPYFTVKISNANRSIQLNYSVRNEFLFVRCDHNSQHQPMVLVNHHCGGTGCSETNFAIIEPQKLEVLLTPSQEMLGNYAQAKKIMGTGIKPFSCKTYSRTSKGSQHNGEFCYVSPIELGNALHLLTYR